jgi:RNA polymerase sigma-70 factor (ECF subfamily)
MFSSYVYNISSAQEKPPLSGQDGLISKAKNGNGAAFAEIYNHFFKKIYQFVYFRVGHKETAEDLAEDVFIKAFSKISSFKSENLEGWLYRIARNLVIDYYRQKRVNVNLEELENTLVYESSLIEEANLKDQQGVLLKLLKELSNEQQVVIKMKFFEDLDNDEIAEILEKTEGAIRVIQHRAIAKLKELIDKNSF